VTQERILRQEMFVTEGDPADPVRIERSRQAIMDLGLFVSVHAELETSDTGTVLHIQVKEKYYILPVPRLNHDENYNFSIGGELTVDNIAGLNQQLKLTYEHEDAAALTGGQVAAYSLSFNSPRVAGSPYQFSASATEASGPAEIASGGVVTTLYELEAWTASAQVSRWLNRTGPSQGWQIGGGLVWRRNKYDYIFGAPSDQFADVQAVGITARLGYIFVHDYLYSRSGVDYGYSGEYGTPPLGSDTLYSRHEIYYRKYVLLDGRPHENIDMQFRLGLSSGDMFPTDTYAYSVGGNRTLRGYPSGAFAGNAFFVANVQYLRPLFGYNMLRGVVFVDAGNAYPSNNELHLGDLHWDVGVGMRLRLKSFVKIDLRLDAAYGYETGEWRYFAGTKEMF
jgi:outer membrane protein assembly factor BamA